MNWLSLLPFAFFFVLLFFFGMGKTCPKCGNPLPSFQSPRTKTKRQWFEGGFHCRHCGCESDVSGNKVASGASPNLLRIFVGIALIVVAAVPAAVMIMALLQQ